MQAIPLSGFDTRPFRLGHVSGRDTFIRHELYGDTLARVRDMINGVARGRKGDDHKGKLRWSI